MSAPILVLADIHGNLEALEAVLESVAGRYRKIWVVGDIFGYGPDPLACFDLLRDLDALMVAGNHDQAAAGIVDAAHFNHDARAALHLHRKLLDDARKALLAGLPTVLIQQSITLVHGNLDNPIWGYTLTALDAGRVLAATTTPLTLVGHTHLPALWTYEPDFGVRAKRIPYGRELHYTEAPHLANPGSVGQPRDKDVSARYMILNPERKTMVFERCPWPFEPFRRKMRTRGYPEALIRRMIPGN